MVVILIYFETVGLFSLYLMNFMFHTTLDAAGNIVGVHYKSMKCDVSLSQGKVSTLFRCDEHIFHVCVKAFFLLTAVQNYLKNSAVAEMGGRGHSIRAGIVHFSTLSKVRFSSHIIPKFYS